MEVKKGPLEEVIVPLEICETELWGARAAERRRAEFL